MTIRRAAVLAVVAVLALFGLTAPALAASPSPAYPPTNPILRIDKTLVRVGGTATVFVSQCKPNTSATITVAGPGRAPGSNPVEYPITIDGAGEASLLVTFTRLGRNSVTLVCTPVGGGADVTASLFVTVAAAPGSGGGGTIGEDESAGGGSGGSTDTAGLDLAGLAATGARLVGPLLLGAGLLGLGALLVTLSRRRRSA